MTVESTRVEWLREADPAPGRHVLYWMGGTQREALNPALEFAVERANRHGVPLLVVFGLMDDYPEANLRHVRFMLQGLAETATAIRARGIGFALRRGYAADIATAAARDAVEVVCDRGYLRHHRAWRHQFAEQCNAPFAVVETEAVVPLRVASTKAEYAARTIRPRIHRHLADYLRPLAPVAIDQPWIGEPPESESLDDIDALLERMSLDRTVGAVDPFFIGGYSQARRRLEAFLAGPIDAYADRRSHPAEDVTTALSPYLHFGQISAIELALAVQARRNTHETNREDFIEELIVRRQLAQNFCEFIDDYDAYACLPEWARKTLDEHRDDPREHLYSEAELAEAKTHDRFWNAAMNEMRITGFMHNYMRMYWGKKIIEWSATPEEAHRVTLALNNRYFLDGRDPNSYASVNWLYGLHDRAWTERPVFGKIRYMNANGLKRKFDMDGYLDKVARLRRRAREAGLS
ncbi:MAG: deoxyribodipyrimidine photo-lyase [Pseudomonadota bacterium]